MDFFLKQEWDFTLHLFAWNADKNRGFEDDW